MNDQSLRKFDPVFTTYRLYHGLIVDLFEQQFSGQDNWRTTRARLLSLLGESGFEGRLKEILSNEGVGK